MAIDSMKNVLLTMTVQTTKSLARKAKIEEFQSVLRELPGFFVPDKFGFSEPIRNAFILSEAPQQLAPLYGPDGESVDLRFTGAVKGGMHLNTIKGPFAWYNGLRIRFDYAKGFHYLSADVVTHALLAFVRFCDAEYACATLSGGHLHRVYTDDPRKNWGEMEGIPVPAWDPMGIEHVPGINWINVFGAKYISFFGRDVLAGLRAWRAEFMENGRWFWLQISEHPKEMLLPPAKTLAEQIQRQLGHPNAFYGFDPSIPSAMAKYATPDFDFSEIRTPPRPENN